MKKALSKMLLLALVLVLTCSLAVSCKKDPPPDDDKDDDPTNTPTEVYLTKDGASDYKIVYSTADNKGGSYAYALNQCIGFTLSTSDDAAEQVAKEILLGDTSRQLSSDLKADALSKYAQDSHVWAFAYRDGKFAFYFNTSVAFDKGIKKFEELFMKDGNFVALDDTWQTFEITKAAYDAEVKAEEDRLKAEAEAKKKAELVEREAVAKAMLANFDSSKFGVTANWATDYSMPTNVYPAP
jgi:hypothetical protein